MNVFRFKAANTDQVTDEDPSFYCKLWLKILLCKCIIYSGESSTGLSMSTPMKNIADLMESLFMYVKCKITLLNGIKHVMT